MNLQPRLTLTDMDMAQCDVLGTMSYKRVRVELWKEVGIALHWYEHRGIIGSLQNDGYECGYRISHYQSGRSVLKRIKGRSQAIAYMMELHAVLSDWRGTYDQMISISNTMPIVERVISLQDKIDNTKE